MSIAAPNWLLELGTMVAREDHPLKDVIAASVDSLKDSDRRAINMYFYEELTYAEIAEEFGLAGKQSGQYRVRRAIRALAEVLQEKGITNGDTRTD